MLSELRPARVGEPLSEQQIELLRLMCAGLRQKQICQRMALNRSTVAYHRSQIAQKTGCQTDAQIGAWAVLNGHFDPEPKGAAE